MADPAFLVAATGLGLSGIVSAVKLITWFLESDPKAIAQGARWGGVGLFALSFPLLLGLVVNQRWTEATGLSAMLLMAFALYGPRVLGQFLPRLRLVPDQSWPATGTSDWKPVDGGASGAEMVQRSIAVLEEYLRRTTRGFAYDAPQIRASSSQIGDGPRQGDANGPRPELTTHVMPEAEALEVLGLRPDAEASEINEAHRRVMQIVHPDRGGSKYFAVKVNQAKDVLLNRLQPQSESSATTAPRKRRRRDRDQRDLSEPRSAIGE
jgi:hypothetical protein